MENLQNMLPYASLLIGGWSVLNGILHDIFVLLRHKGGYNRDLLRLLMDGHILITCGGIQMVAYKLLVGQNPFGYYISGLAALSLLLYCVMIWPFLKSIFTMLLQVSLLLLLILSFPK